MMGAEVSRPRADLHRAVMLGAVERVRPKMMTVAAIMAGLVPILWSTGAGSEVMQRIAAPMIGGMVSLTLIVIPAIYALVKEARIAAVIEQAGPLMPPSSESGRTKSLSAPKGP